jgi:hypothetical protein
MAADISADLGLVKTLMFVLAVMVVVALDSGGGASGGCRSGMPRLLKRHRAAGAARARRLAAGDRDRAEGEQASEEAGEPVHTTLLGGPLPFVQAARARWTNIARRPEYSVAVHWTIQ